MIENKLGLQPEMLSAGIKLEPLGVVDVAATLPEICLLYTSRCV